MHGNFRHLASGLLLAAVAALLVLPGSRRGQDHRGRRHRREVPAELPDEPLRGDLAHDRVPDARRRPAEDVRRAQGRQDRRLVDHARDAEAQAAQVLRGEPRRRRAGRDLRAPPGRPPLRPRHGREPGAEAHAVLRPDGAVPAQHLARDQEGRRRRADGADLGARARPRPGPRQRLAREPRRGRLRRHADAERADRPAGPDAVQVRLPHRAADLQRDADHDAGPARSPPPGARRRAGRAARRPRSGRTACPRARAARPSPRPARARAGTGARSSSRRRRRRRG